LTAHVGVCLRFNVHRGRGQDGVCEAARISASADALSEDGRQDETPRVYADRTAGGDWDHRGAGGDSVAGIEPCAGCSASDEMPGERARVDAGGELVHDGVQLADPPRGHDEVDGAAGGLGGGDAFAGQVAAMPGGLA